MKKQSQKTIVQNDFLQRPFHNFYITKDQIAVQTVTRVNKQGDPEVVKTDYYKKTPERVAAIKKSKRKPGKRIVGKKSQKCTKFYK